MLAGARALGAVCGVTLAVSTGSACRTSPAEAPPPDASAWPDDGFGAALDDDPTRADDPSPTAARARPPGAIFRDEIERATGPGPAYLLRQLGPEPYRHHGHFVGWEITTLFPDDPQLCAPACDLATGDVILEVNGNRLKTPQELSAALQALPGWNALKVTSLRDGQRRQVTYPIVEEQG